MPKKHVNIQFSHNVSLAGLADELTAVKTAIMLISAKLPLSANPQDICVSLRNMGSVKCNEMADLIDSVIYKEN
ncbi:hypothetical protein D9P95_14450 [Salmonella enterica subsp. enterica serovar Sandiego]|uniref:hypothetical protein n=1 Tax=Salmonella enterica TaxID=28901 RepID=UPI0009ABF295|nr:hypothetical protein [Salmonella enterica]EBZ3097675.1 hypothetical protein [Salmonella enterica subsp. enterica serovar Sandiego]EDL0767181.1 hypothetical protein [Salmonella enterica subsp. enterica serovar Muenchen]EEB4926582.1 hypothetical protein [Salmonella enterica subsp. enterica serovar Brandenburg]EEJ1462555.1 hypothetical protein [Salmonella enterica subsp. enterica serovar Virginia]EKB3328153.1 hypothetical protein [Salmonella enterica subsp. enterica serovar Chandans]HBJ696173